MTRSLIESLLNKGSLGVTTVILVTLIMTKEVTLFFPLLIQNQWVHGCQPQPPMQLALVASINSILVMILGSICSVGSYTYPPVKEMKMTFC